MSHLSLRVSPSEEIKLIISVSKKVSKKAVVRNRIKRRVRAAIRPLIKDLKPRQYLLIARTGSENLRGIELKEELIGLIRSIRN